MSSFAVILPAAGTSSRFGGTVKKTQLILNGRPLWEHSARLFLGRPDVAQVLLVVAAEDRDLFAEHCRAEASLQRIELVIGGRERFESVAHALAQVRDECGWVAIHDAARPCLTTDRVEAVFHRAIETGAAMLAVPVADTIKQADGEQRVAATVPRAGLWLAQTPQVFRRDWLLEAHANRKRQGDAITDDAQLVEAAGHVVHLIPGHATNIKVTRPDDLRLAEAILRSQP